MHLPQAEPNAVPPSSNGLLPAPRHPTLKALGGLDEVGGWGSQGVGGEGVEVQVAAGAAVWSGVD